MSKTFAAQASGDVEQEAHREELSTAIYHAVPHLGDQGNSRADSDCYCVRCCAIRYLASHRSREKEDSLDETPTTSEPVTRQERRKPVSGKEISNG